MHATESVPVSGATSAYSASLMPADLFSSLEAARFGDVHLRADCGSQLRAIIAIHSTALGPAIGGCRFVHYEHSADALADALRLARGMSYKAALAGLPFGGGKAVLMHPGRVRDRAALLRSFGRFVESLGGRYITAVDSGTSVADMDIVATETTHVTGTSRTGDASAFTAAGVLRGIEAAARLRWQRDDLSGLHIAIQGVGKVGARLARSLAARGVRLTLADVDDAAARSLAWELGASVVAPGRVLEVSCDVFAPCALGGVLNAQTVPRVAASVVAGAANNQLDTEADGAALHNRGILYVPDYVINAGGLIGVAPLARDGATEARWERVHALHDTVLTVLERAARENRPTGEVADAMAERILYGHGPTIDDGGPAKGGRAGDPRRRANA